MKNRAVAELEAVRLSEIHRQVFVVLRHRGMVSDSFSCIPEIGTIPGDDVVFRTSQKRECAALDGG